MSIRRNRLFLAGALTLSVALASVLSSAYAAPPGDTHGAGSSAANATGPLSVTISTDKKTYTVGEPIQLTLTVRNTTKAPLTLDFSSGQRFDFEVRRGASDGPIVWQWSRGMMFTEMITHTTLQPDKSLSFNATLSNKGRAVSPSVGSYTVIGTLTTMPRTARPHGSATFIVK